MLDFLFGRGGGQAYGYPPYPHAQQYPPNYYPPQGQQIYGEYPQQRPPMPPQQPQALPQQPPQQPQVPQQPPPQPPPQQPPQQMPQYPQYQQQPFQQFIPPEGPEEKIDVRHAAAEVLRALGKLNTVCLIAIVFLVVTLFVAFLDPMPAGGIALVGAGVIGFFFATNGKEIRYLRNKYGV